MVDVVDRDGNRDRKQFETRSEADAFRIKIESEIGSGSYPGDAGKIIIDDLADLYIEHIRGRMERRERMTQRNFDVYVGHIGQVDIRQLTATSASHSHPLTDLLIEGR